MKVLILDAIFLLIASIIPIFRLPLSKFVNPVDLNFSFSPKDSFVKFLFSWFEERNGFSNIIISIHNLPLRGLTLLLEKLGFSLPLINKLWCIVPLWILGLAGYFFAKTWVEKEKNKRRIALLTAFLLIYSQVSLVSFALGWSTKYLIPLAFSIFLFTAFAKGLKGKKKFKYIALGACCSLISAGLLQCLIISLVVTFAFFLYYSFLEKQGKIEKKKNFVYLIKFVFAVVLANSWWLLPFFYLSFHGFSYYHLTPEQLISGSKSWNTFLRTILLRNADPGFPVNQYTVSKFTSIAGLILLFFSFASLLIKRFRRKTLFWAGVILWLLVFAGGTAAPFGTIYRFFFNNFPYFYIFREISKFNGFIALGFAFLAACFLDFIISKAEKLKKRASFLIKKFIFTLIILIVAINSFPLVTGNLGGGLEPFEIPNNYKDISLFLNSADSRVLVLPFTDLFSKFNWSKNQVHMINPLKSLVNKPLIYDEFRNINLNQNQQNLWEQISNKNLNQDNSYSIANQLALLNTEWVLLQSDQKQKLAQMDSKKNLSFFSKTLNFFNTSDNFDLKAILGDLFLYRISDEYYLPHFYIPQNIIYSPNDTKILAEMLSFNDYKTRSAIFLADNADKEWVTQIGVDEIFVEPKLENTIDKDYFEKKADFKNNVLFPYVKHKPGKLGWELSRLKEKYEEWKLRRRPEKLIDKKLFYAGKRISEAKKFGAEDINIQINYKRKIQEIIEKIGNLENPKVKEDNIIKLRAGWEKHKEQVEKIGESKNWEKIFNNLDERIKPLEKEWDLKNLKYKLEIPQEREYEILISSEDFGKTAEKQMEGVTMTIDYVKISTESATKRKDKWVSFGEKNLEKGNHELVLELPEPKNLLKNNWQKQKEVNFKQEEVEFSLEGFFASTRNSIFQEINDWQANKFYYLTLDYKTEGGNLRMGILEDKLEFQKEEWTVKTEKIFERNLKNAEEKKWNKFETIIKSDSDTVGAKIYFWSTPNSNKFGKVNFKNLRIYKIIQPKIILRANVDNIDREPITQTPKIKFIKINPTKYKIKVTDATEPYTLVFSESFHEGWKIYVDNTEKSANSADEKALITQIMGIMGKVATKITELFLKNKDYGGEVTSYFNSEIKEGTHRMTFLEPATFETWGKEPIVNDNHHLVNGYANSWYIKPENVGGQKNYELIIEFWPQRLFYIGLAITFSILIGTLSCLIINLLSARSA